MNRHHLPHRLRAIGGFLGAVHPYNRALWLGLLACIGASLFSPAHAMKGFTMGYAKIDNWTLQAPPPLPTRKGEGSLLCPSEDELIACLSGLDADNGSVVLNGATSQGVTQWFVQNDSGRDYQISFDWQYTNWSTDRSNYATYQVGALPGSGREFRAQESTSAVVMSLPAQQYITFSIHTLNTVNTSDDLTISNYNSTVPGPIPAAGGAAGFAWSRRLRRRVAGQSHGKPRTSPAQQQPAYLDLRPLDGTHLSACFAYTNLPLPKNDRTSSEQTLEANKLPSS